MRETMLEFCTEGIIQWGFAVLSTIAAVTIGIIIGTKENNDTIIVFSICISALLFPFAIRLLLQLHGYWIWKYHRTEQGSIIKPDLPGWRGSVADLLGKYDY